MKKFLLRMHKEEGGTAAVTFLLCLPVVMTVIAIIVQFALILNAKLIVTDAAIAGARAAVTSLPEEKEGNIRKAALFMLVTVSPPGQGNSQDGQQIESALQTLGAKAPTRFASRFAYADAASEVNYLQDDYKQMPGQQVEVTVAYKFYLEIPIARGLLATNNETVGGVNGKFFRITSKVKVQTSHGRATQADSETGEPLDTE